MASIELRLQRLESVKGGEVAPEDRWWCALLPENERADCLTEPLDWATVEREWWECMSEVLNETGTETTEGN